MLMLLWLINWKIYCCNFIQLLCNFLLFSSPYCY